jgi:hypothetical protein
MLKAVSTHAKDKDSESNDFDLRSSIDIIHGYVFPIKTWTHMMEDDRLPKNCKQGRIIYELDWNLLRIREVASLAHDAAANALTPQSDAPQRASSGRHRKPSRILKEPVESGTDKETNALMSSIKVPKPQPLPKKVSVIQSL